MLKGLTTVGGTIAISYFNPIIGITFGAISLILLSVPDKHIEEIDDSTFYNEFLDSHLDELYKSLIDSGYDDKSALNQINSLFSAEEVTNIKQSRAEYNNYRVNSLDKKPIDYKWFN
jgi:hypothetical protein